jgi:Tfp pilus assembly protein PilF
VVCSSFWSISIRAARAGRDCRVTRQVFVLATLLATIGCTTHRPSTAGRSELAERLTEEARQARDRGDSRSAEYLLTSAVDHNPGDCETRLELAELLLAHGSYEAAELHLNRFIDQCPDDPRGYAGLAEIMFLRKRLREADELVEKTLELDPRQTRGLVLRGQIEHARHDDDRALEDLYYVLSLEADHNEAKLLIAEIHLQQGNAKLAAPLLRSVIDEAEPANSQRPAAEWLLGKCYACEERWSDAARELQAGMASRRGTAQDWTELAEAYWRSGDAVGAEMAVDKALRAAPTDPQALTLRAVLDDWAQATAQSAGPAVTGLSHDE